MWYGYATQGYTVDEPMVAFVCNRPAMHSTDRGWVSDDSSNCISDPVDVLNYCRKVLDASTKLHHHHHHHHHRRRRRYRIFNTILVGGVA